MNNLANKVGIFIKRNSATILTCIGAVGVVGTAVAAAKATPKAMDILEEATVEAKENETELTTFDKVKIVAPVYIPSVIIGVSTIACIFGANTLNKRQQAALVSAYALIDNSYKEYKAKLKELYGEEAHNNIVDSIVKEECKDVYINAPFLTTNCSSELDDSESEVHLFYDEYSERYFETTNERVQQSVYHLNRNYILRGCASLNEWYEFLGLEKTDYGEMVGWDINQEIYWIDFNYRKVILDGDLECYIIEMPFCPRRRMARRILKRFAKKTHPIMKDYKGGIAL